MLFSFGVLLVLCGLGIMGFGLFIFYGWLPLFYALIGFEIGFLLGKWLAGSVGTIAVMLGIVGGVAAASATYILEPYRRILLGYWGGALISLSLALHGAHAHPGDLGCFHPAQLLGYSFQNDVLQFHHPLHFSGRYGLAHSASFHPTRSGPDNSRANYTGQLTC